MAVYGEQPCAHLQSWVECGWFYETDIPVSIHRVPPDGCVDILYARGLGLRAIGTMTVEQGFAVSAGSLQAGVRFRPGMSGPFLGVSPAELTDRGTPLENLWPGGRARELQGQLDDAKSIRDAMRLLLQRLPTPATEPDAVQKAIQGMTRANGVVDVDDCACQANLSIRQFRRRCLEASGVGPKLLSRILRFRHACRLARAATDLNWSTVATDADYFDQAHLIRDFREFTGRTPTSLFSKTAGPGDR